MSILLKNGTVIDYASKWIPEYTNFISKSIENIEICDLFDILKLI